MGRLGVSAVGVFRPLRGGRLNVLDYRDLIGSIARSYASSYPHVEVDDCSQELFLHLLKPSVQRSINRATDPDRNVAFQLWARAHAYQREMRRQGLIDVQDQYHYSPGVVKSALEVGLRYLVFDQVPAWPASDEEDSGVRAVNDPAEGNNLQAIMLDVLRGFDGLSRADQDLLVRNHLDGLSLAEIAAELQDEVKTVQKRHERAVDRLIDQLGGARRVATAEHAGPGGRRAVSNAAAQRMLD